MSEHEEDKEKAVPGIPKDLAEVADIDKGLREFFGEEFPEVVVIDKLSPEFVLRSIEARLTEEGWDQPPQMIFLRGNDLGIETVDLELPDPVKEDFIHAFPRWVASIMAAIGQMRNGEDNENVQEVLDFHKEVLGAGFQGFVFSSEGWMVKPPPDDASEEEKAEYAHARASGKFHEHPKRIEVRNTVLVTPFSDFYTLTRPRGEEPVYMVIGGKDWKFQSLGMLPELLRMWMQVCVLLQGVTGFYDEDVVNYWAEQQRQASEIIEAEMGHRVPDDPSGLFGSD